MSDVAPDGSPVAVYLTIPAEPDLSWVRSMLRPGATVLDLGCGVGRIASPLARDGHVVVAVDNSAEMLAEVVGAETVLAEIWALALDRRFDVVLALSHLVDCRSPAQRVELLRVCRRHLRDDGIVLVQRYPPDWTPRDDAHEVAGVAVHLHDVEGYDDGFAAQVTYAIGDRSWTQVFEGAVVGDSELAAAAAAAGLVVRAVLDDAGAWVVLAAQ
jgi:SAM-dependent methyltransferase